MLRCFPLPGTDGIRGKQRGGREPSVDVEWLGPTKSRNSRAKSASELPVQNENGDERTRHRFFP
jgi:hypothetical protein